MDRALKLESLKMESLVNLLDHGRLNESLKCLYRLSLATTFLIWLRQHSVMFGFTCLCYYRLNRTTVTVLLRHSGLKQWSKVKTR